MRVFTAAHKQTMQISLASTPLTDNIYKMSREFNLNDIKFDSNHNKLSVSDKKSISM